MILRLEVACYLAAYLLFGWRGVLAALLLRILGQFLLHFTLGRLAVAAEKLAAERADL